MNIGGILILLLVLAGKVYFIRRYIKALKAPVNDFSFGREDFKLISKAILKSNFTDAEQRLKQLNSDDLTQAIDHIVIACSEKSLLKFHRLTDGGDCSAMLLGAWYLYNAWKIRGHKIAAELSGKQLNGYVDNLMKAGPMLQIATRSPWLSAEAHSRLIRVDMGLNHQDSAIMHFKDAVKADPNHLWAHIHFAESIQPKWGGSTDDVRDFLGALPNNYLIKTIVKLKLLNDSINTGQNYFNLGNSAEEVNEYVFKTIMAIDAELDARPVASIQKFILYGYMYVWSGYADKAFEKKYKKLLSGNYTLYPFGIL